MLVLSIPAIQTKLGTFATDFINEDYETDITIGKVGLQFNGDVELKDILILDFKKDTLISASELNTSVINFRNLIDGTDRKSTRLNSSHGYISYAVFCLKKKKKKKA